MAKGAEGGPSLMWEGADLPRVAPGDYQAACVAWQGPELVRAYRRWSIRLPTPSFGWLQSRPESLITVPQETVSPMRQLIAQAGLMSGFSRFERAEFRSALPCLCSRHQS